MLEWNGGMGHSITVNALKYNTLIINFIILEWNDL